MHRSRTAAALDERAAIIDEFGRLDAELALMKPKVKRHEELRKQIQSWYENENPTVGFVAKGLQYGVIVGAKARERKIVNMARLAKLLGARFVDLCTFPLSALDANTTAEQRDGIVTEGHTGSRTVRAVPVAVAQ
jgi:hypothetical protein